MIIKNVIFLFKFDETQENCLELIYKKNEFVEKKF